MRIKLAFQKAFGKGEITREQESAFLQLKSDLSRFYRTVADRLPKDLSFDGDQMIEILKNAISMQHLQNQAIAEKRTLFSNWHKIYVKMTRTFGALEVINDGYYPQLHREMVREQKKTTRTGGPKGKKGASTNKKLVG